MKELNELYKLYYKKIFAYLYGLTGNRELSEDLLQETFYQVYVSIGNFRGDSKVSTWIYQIAKYTYLNENRRIIKNNKIEKNLKITYKNIQTPEAATLVNEEREELLIAIEKLPETQREVVILRAFNDLSFKDIGSVFNKTENWAKVNYYRAKDKLFETLKERGVDNEI